MSEQTDYSHDTLGHILKEYKLEIPQFQRSYSWSDDNVEEFLSDINRAIDKNRKYFLGTVVLVKTENNPKLFQIVDGQQRLVTTALTYIALSRKLIEIGEPQASNEIQKNYIAQYDLKTKEVKSEFTLSNSDAEIYNKIIGPESLDEIRSDFKKFKKDKLKIFIAFETICKFFNNLTEGLDKDGKYQVLVSYAEYLKESCEVLLAKAPDLSDAYVIFETLNDRGADLTTVDLLKNYLLSISGSQNVNQALNLWTALTSRLDEKALLSFIKYHYISQRGPVSTRNLYKHLQEYLEGKSSKSINYQRELVKYLDYYEALLSSDHKFWSNISDDVSDEVMAHRRFNIRITFSMFMAAMGKWKTKEFCKLIKFGTNWAIRATVVGTIGGGTAEKVFGELAKKISTGELKNVEEVRKEIQSTPLLPTDTHFVDSIVLVDDQNLTRVKYYLAMIEKQYCLEIGESPEKLPSWHSKNISVEHIIAKSSHVQVSEDGTGTLVSELQHSISNLTLLERGVNNDLDDLDFAKKVNSYHESAYPFTRKLYDYHQFSDVEIGERRQMIQTLASKAWAV